MHVRGRPTAEGTEGWRWGTGGWGGLAVGSEDAHLSHPPPHLSVMGSLAVRGAEDGDTTSLLLASALLF